MATTDNMIQQTITAGVNRMLGEIRGYASYPLTEANVDLFKAEVTRAIRLAQQGENQS